MIDESNVSNIKSGYFDILPLYGLIIWYVSRMIPAIHDVFFLTTVQQEHSAASLQDLRRCQFDDKITE